MPQNTKLLGYWGIVEDRLNKIRSCENLQGQIQLMPLFDAPIDPGMLVAATAAGLDLGSAVSGLNQPTGPFRAQVLIQKATEMAAEVRSLGASLLAAIEKGEAEHLAQLRQTHEVGVQQSIQNVRFLQWQQAQAATEALLRTRASALERYTFYLRLLNLAPDPATVPDTFTVDHTLELTEANFSDVYQTLVGQYDLTITTQAYPKIQWPAASSPAVQSGAAGAGQLYLNSNEYAELNLHMPAARDTRLASGVYDTLASVLTFIPEFTTALEFMGLGANADVFGGKTLADEFKIMAEILRTQATWETDQGGDGRADRWVPAPRRRVAAAGQRRCAGSSPRSGASSSPRSSPSRRLTTSTPPRKPRPSRARKSLTTCRPSSPTRTSTPGCPASCPACCTPTTGWPSTPRGAPSRL